MDKGAHPDYVQEAVLPNEMQLHDGVKWVEVGQHADGSGGVGGEGDDDVLVRESRRETSRKFDGGAMILGIVLNNRLHVGRIRRLTASDEDTQEQVWKKFQEVRRTRRLIIERYHLESTTTVVPYSDRAYPKARGTEAVRRSELLIGGDNTTEGRDGADKQG